MFEDLIGNKLIKEYLKDTISSNNVSHSYMFAGKSGIGKKLFAREYAKRIMCIEKSNKLENNLDDKYIEEKDRKCECDSCIKFNALSNPDFYEIEPDGKTLKIDQIREIQKSIAQKPIVSQRKVYIINNADTMSEEAQNCLLKTLEEPPEYAIIILIVCDENKMLATIKSRCIIVKFQNLTNEELKNYLPDISDDMIQLLEGSLEKANEIEQKKEEYIQLSKIVDNLKNGTMIENLNNSNLLYEQKDDIMNLLEYMNIIFFEQKILNPIQIIEKTKRKILLNNNYDMCIDNLLMNIWEELH